MATAVPTHRLEAQLPTTPQEARRMLQEDPEAVRRALMNSGMTESEIRARLAAAGLPADQFDRFLSGEPIDPTLPVSPESLTGLQALGLAIETADGIELVETTAGMQPGSGRLEEEEEEAFPIFGHDVLTRATSLFQPLLSGPAPPGYRVGPGDELVLILTGEVEAAYQLSVAREGFVVVPVIGRISVANLTMEDLHTLLRTRLAASYSGIDRGTTTVDVSLTSLRANQIFVSGAVVQPGSYQLASVATVTNALYAAGGPTELGSIREVRVQHRDGTTSVLDLYPYLLSGDARGDIVLQQGDVVFVPTRSRRVQVHGAVTRAAQFDLAPSDDLADVLRAAGGFAPEANRQRLTLHRVVRPDRRGPGLADRLAFDVELGTVDDPTVPGNVGGVLVPPVGLQDGDSIVVDEVPELAAGYYVTISGMVVRPDTIPWREGMTLRELLLMARGTTVGADLREAEVTRLPDNRAVGELADRLRVPLDSSYLSQRAPDGRYVGPAGVPFPPAGSAPEFVLQPFDQVRIMRQPDFEMPRTVTVTGEVSVPGDYTLLSKSDRVSDLIERAAGLLDTGYPEGARLYRSLDDMGRIDLNLPAALASPGAADDVILQPGDSLHVPVYSPTVRIRGAVISPVTVLYREGEDFEYYIANAGGYRNDADKGRIAVRYANGRAETRSRFLFWSSYPRPGPGGEIFVPAKDPADRIDTRGLIADVVAILGSITTVIVVLAR